MPTLVAQPTRISAAGTKPKLIDEYIGRVNTKTAGVSVAHMHSPQGWQEPGQTPEFDEFWCSKAGCECSTRTVTWRSRQDKPSSLMLASGSSTHLLPKAAQNISPSACPLFPWTRFTATNNQPSGRSDFVLLVACRFVPASFIPKGKFDSIPKSKFVVDVAKVVFHHVFSRSNQIGNFAVFESLRD
jgi:hypothetical protein